MSLKKFKILANNYTNKNELNIGKNIKYYSVNKIGYVFKENVLLKKSEIYDLQAKLKNSVYNDVKNDIKEIYSLLHITYEEIYDLIQIENSLNISNNFFNCSTYASPIYLP